MEPDIEPKSPKRAKIDEEENVATKQDENPRPDTSDKISADSTTDNEKTLDRWVALLTLNNLAAKF